jgi:threonine synthase
MIRYISTRGPGEPKNFNDVLLSGMAPDGGLYIPDTWPEIDHNLLSYIVGTPYTTIASQVMWPFVESSMTQGEFQSILQQTYETGAFDTAAIAPLKQLGPNAWIMELFHGPTLSFKDYAMQLLGNLFDHALNKEEKRITIVAATSGDTGSAAIEAFKNCKNIDLFVLHPKDKISEVQRLQMTTVEAPNIFNIAVEGNFDDCQAMVKGLFADSDINEHLNLSAVNSINWARIMAQMGYYFAAGLAMGAPGRSVSFVVPTGNFGNAYAGWAARRMGLSVNRLVIATNKNDILSKFYSTGNMRIGSAAQTLSPSMDIQSASNFERYLCDLMGRDHNLLNQLLSNFQRTKSFTINADIMAPMRREFDARSTTDEETLETMRSCYESTGVIIDPHTAVGLHAAMSRNDDPSIPVVVLSTAHPAKFPEAIKQAIGKEPNMPAKLLELVQKPEKVVTMRKDLNQLKNFVRQNSRT